MRTYDDFVRDQALIPSSIVRKRIEPPGWETKAEKARVDLDWHVLWAHLFAFRTRQAPPVVAELVSWLPSETAEIEASLARLTATGWLRDVAADERTLLEPYIGEVRHRGICAWCWASLMRTTESPEGRRCASCMGLVVPLGVDVMDTKNLRRRQLDETDHGSRGFFEHRYDPKTLPLGTPYVRTTEMIEHGKHDWYVFAAHLFAMRNGQRAPTTAEIAAWHRAPIEPFEAARARLAKDGWLSDVRNEEKLMICSYPSGMNRELTCGWCKTLVMDMRKSPEGKRCPHCLGLMEPAGGW